MLAAQQTEYGIRSIGNSVTVPNDPRARLMYYLNCICFVLEIDDDSNIQRLRDFNSYYSISTVGEKRALIYCCGLLSPDILEGKCIFNQEGLPDSSNKFLELSKVQTSLAVTSNILIGGQIRRVTKIMLYEMQWLRAYYLNPLRDLIQEIETPRRAITWETRATPSSSSSSYTETRRRNSSSSCCTIV
jgi:hypothetical protein